MYNNIIFAALTIELNKNLIISHIYRFYLKANNVFFFLISKSSLFQSLDPFTLKDDLYR